MSNKERFRQWMDTGVINDFSVDSGTDGQEKKCVHHESTVQERAEEFHQIYGEKMFNTIYRTVSIIVCISIIATLLLGVANLPAFGAGDNPSANEVTKRYLEQGMEETGAVNIVAGMILDYRAFDTFGESAVLFLAVICVVALLRSTEQNTELISEPNSDIILKTVSNIAVPLLMILGFYIVLNGHLSPGGGFSGGAIMGAGLILYSIVNGYQTTHRFFNYKVFTRLSSSALLVYALSKGYSFFTGANHLPSVITTGTPGKILSAGLILPLNICVGLVVMGTMYSFYSLFRYRDI